MLRTRRYNFLLITLACDAPVIMSSHARPGRLHFLRRLQRIRDTSPYHLIYASREKETTGPQAIPRPAVTLYLTVLKDRLRFAVEA